MGTDQGQCQGVQRRLSGDVNNNVEQVTVVFDTPDVPALTYCQDLEAAEITIYGTCQRGKVENGKFLVFEPNKEASGSKDYMMAWAVSLSIFVCMLFVCGYLLYRNLQKRSTARGHEVAQYDEEAAYRTDEQGTTESIEDGKDEKPRNV